MVDTAWLQSAVREGELQRQSERQAGCVAVLVTAALTGSLIWWVFGSFMEARAYNHVTGSNVTTWEAMWLDLRVNGEPK